MLKGHQEKIVWIVGLTLIGLVLLGTFGRPLFEKNGEDPDSAGKDFMRISAEELEQRISSGEKISLLDARSKENYATEHILDALSVNPESVRSTLNGIPKDQAVVIIGSSYLEAQKVATVLEQDGYQNIFILVGGMTAWQKNKGGTISWGDPNSFIDQAKVKFISAEDANSKMAQKNSRLIFLDVRSKELFSVSHITGAINIPLAEIENEQQNIPRGKEVVIYGETELQSFQAAVKLFDLGFFSARSLQGTFASWQQKKFPTETGLSEQRLK